MANSLRFRGFAPLYLAGFTTAFGAHSVAVVLGSDSADIGLTLLSLGLVLALYDVAEVLLKPFFGALSDRIGAKPVIVGGLLAFVVASVLVLFSTAPLMLAIARFGQGAAASAFSPASSAALARVAGRKVLGRYFGRYGAWKSLGYAAGPLIGVGLVSLGGLRLLYLCLAFVALGAAIWVSLALPSIPIVPRARYTLADLARQTAERGFLIPTLLLATSTAVLGVAIGFLPLLATNLDQPPYVGASIVALLAIVSALVQPAIGRLRDQEGISTAHGGLVAFAQMAAALVLLALLPNLLTLCLAAVAVGLLTGIVTPLAFAHLAVHTPEQRMGRTMGNAELGREVGDAAGPLLVGAVATAATLPLALGVLGVLSLGAGLLGWGTLRERQPEANR